MKKTEQNDPCRTHVSARYALLMGVLMAMTMGFSLPYLLLNVDEAAWCARKAAEQFPELFLASDGAYAASTRTCAVGRIEDAGENITRDGVVYLSRMASAPSTERFVLTDSADLAVVASDDWLGALLGAGFLVGLAAGTMALSAFDQ